MKIQTRLVLLLACLLLIFAAAAQLLRLAQRHEAERMIDDLRDERSRLLDRLIALRDESLVNFASDYSLWDEMVHFLDTADPAWAAVNIDTSLPNFSAHGAWVLHANGSLLYAARQRGHLAGIAPPFDDPAFLAHLRRHKSIHFFQQTPEGLLEIRTGPILPSADVNRQQEPRGWFLVGRLWDRAALDALGDSLQGRVSLDGAQENTPPETIRLERPFTDWHDQRVATLHVAYESAPLASLLAGNRYEVALLWAFGFAIIAVTVLVVAIWVVRPVHRLQRSLDSGSSEPLGALTRASGEFGDLARQLADSFAQRAALRENERLLREAIELRSRLARDLHDGIIQSIYAAGMGLEGLRQLAEQDAVAARRLATCQQLLNDTIWQVRNFINALEPETHTRTAGTGSIAALAAAMQSVQSIPIAVQVDAAVTTVLTVAQETQLLQITRELLSNALRHSHAHQIRLSLRANSANSIQLEVADDGVGFDAASPPASGRGLRNVTARVQEIGGQLTIDAAPGKGARIAVEFRASDSPPR